jgi:hypothetical protein
MTLRQEPPAATESGSGAGAVSLFASTLREALDRRKISLRSIRRRLMDRGYDISISTLSFWQSGARRPERAASIDIIRELEELLYLDDGALSDTLGPSRRVGRSRQRTYAELIELTREEGDEEPDPDLLERSGAVGVYFDADGTTARSVNRTLWQARRDGAQEATVHYYSRELSKLTELNIKGTIGCDLIDAVIDAERLLLRATLRLRVPLSQGELALTERRSLVPPGLEPQDGTTVVARRRQAELLLYAVFDPRRLPTRCRVIVEEDGETRTHAVPLNGDCVSHAEFNFGPGVITLEWDW